jgi:hypothetical protein
MTWVQRPRNIDSYINRESNVTEITPRIRVGSSFLDYEQRWPYRLLEDDEVRIKEDGGLRLMEAPFPFVVIPRNENVFINRERNG